MRPGGAADGPWGLYVHLPFCRFKCYYCDFAVAIWKPGRTEAYVDLLLRSAEDWRRHGPLVGPAAPAEPATAAAEHHRPLRLAAPRTPPASLYYGGGTPTTLPIETFERLHRRLLALYGLADDAEVTVEANPEGVDLPYLQRLRAMGANRLSIGLQTADPQLLHTLGRRHTLADVRRVVRAARAAGFENLSLDLMFGLPGQTLAGWRETLDAALALGPEHISAYGLQVEPNTPFEAWTRQGRLTLPGDEAEADMYAVLRRRLADAGLEQYEISNFAVPGRASRHNLLYWDNGAYLGLGLGAHSHWQAWRWGQTRNLRRWREAVAQDRPATDSDGAQKVCGRQALGDAMMLGLRRRTGIDPERLRRRYGEDPRILWKHEIEGLSRRGLLEWAPPFLRLSDAGLLLGNQVFMAFV